HGVAGNLQRVGMLVVEGGKPDLIPALAGRKAGFVEMAGPRGLRNADQREALPGLRASALLDQPHEGVEGGFGRDQCLGDRLGRGPAGAAVERDPLRLVERGGIEARLPGEGGWREPRMSREAVEGGPDLGVGEHAAGPLAKRLRNIIRLQELPLLELRPERLEHIPNLEDELFHRFFDRDSDGSAAIVDWSDWDKYFNEGDELHLHLDSVRPSCATLRADVVINPGGAVIANDFDDMRLPRGGELSMFVRVRDISQN